MKQRTHPRIFSAIVSLVALAAWLTASNHCAIGSLVPEQVEAADHSHCGGSQQAPTEEDKGGGDCDGSKCCKSLSAPTLAFAKNVISFDTAVFVDMPFLCGAAATIDAQRSDAPCELDTGPPGRESFAESVLQRSILAHAPPAFA